MFEHLTYEDGKKMLAECFRVLVPGGKIRIATPDLEFLINLYGPEKSVLQQNYILFCMEKYGMKPSIPMDSVVINQFFHLWGHRFIYDFKCLKNALEDSGFESVKRCTVSKSTNENLKNMEQHGRIIGDDFNELETLVIEAERPLIQA